MLRLAVISLAFLALVQAELVVKDCHPTGDSIIKVTKSSLEPYPPRLPGKLRVKTNVELLKSLDNMDFNVTIIRYIGGAPIKIPCLDGVGSCVYENFCGILNELFPPGTPCPGGLTQCRCPFKPNVLEIDQELELPQIPPEIAPIVSGMFEMYLQFQDSDSKEVLSCLNVKLEVAADA